MAASLPVSETDEKPKGGLKLFIKKKNEVDSYTVVEIEINGCFEKLLTFLIDGKWNNIHNVKVP